MVSVRHAETAKRATSSSPRARGATGTRKGSFSFGMKKKLMLPLRGRPSSMRSESHSLRRGRQDVARQGGLKAGELR
jgi:hypothetical protein